MSNKLLNTLFLHHAKHKAILVALSTSQIKRSNHVLSTSPQQTNKLLSYASPSAPDGFKLIEETVDQRLAHMVTLRPTSVAYKFSQTDVELTYAELRQRVDEIAQNLLRIGYKRGETLAIMLPNSPEFVLTVLAAASIGVIAMMLNPAFQPFEIELLMRKNECKGIIILDHFKTFNHYETLRSICPELAFTRAGEELQSKKLPHLKHVVVVDNVLMARKNSAQVYSGTMGFGQLERHDTIKKELPLVDKHDVFALLFTSGSTSGFPKSTPVTHHSFINASHTENHYPGCFETNRTLCLPVQMYQGFGLCVGLISSITNGNKIVFPSYIPDTLSTLKAIHDERCTALKGPPHTFTKLLSHPDLRKFDLSSLEQITIAPSTFPKDLILRAKRTLNLNHVVIGYGMSESSCMGSVTRVSDLANSEKYAYESIGQGVPFAELKIVALDASGAIVPRNVDGEIYLKGYNVMKGYWNEPEKSAEVLDDEGWLKTGDIASMDENGYIFFKSRAIDLIVKDNINIYPGEIENVLLKNKKIVECYVFGVPDEAVGEEVCAWVRLAAGSEMTEGELRALCLADQLEPAQVPKHVKFVQTFPTVAGKVQKYKMVDAMISEMHHAISQQKSN